MNNEVNSAAPDKDQIKRIVIACRNYPPDIRPKVIASNLNLGLDIVIGIAELMHSTHCDPVTSRRETVDALCETLAEMGSEQAGFDVNAVRFYANSTEIGVAK